MKSPITTHSRLKPITKPSAKCKTLPSRNKIPTLREKKKAPY